MCEEPTKKEWLKGEVKDLIAAYRSKRCLWDINSRLHKDKDAKIEAFDDLSIAFNTSSEEIMRKIHNLRNQFNSELKKTYKKKYNHGMGDAYVSKWPYFQPMMFLQASVTRRSTGRLDVEMDAEEEHVSQDKQLYQEIPLQPEITMQRDIPLQQEIQLHREIPLQHEMELQREIPLQHEMQLQNGIARQQETSRQQEIPPQRGIPRKQDVPREPVVPQVPNNSFSEKQNFKHPQQLNKEDAFKMALRSITRARDDHQIFGDYVASSLRNLHSEANRRKLRLLIQKAILDVSVTDDSEHSTVNDIIIESVSSNAVGY